MGQSSVRSCAAHHPGMSLGEDKARKERLGIYIRPLED
jgi:hypothetical protein